jgi:hypothetical protein
MSPALIEIGKTSVRGFARRVSLKLRKIPLAGPSRPMAG